MLVETVHSHAEIQALQARLHDKVCSDELMLVRLVSLESVRIAPESYAILRPLIMASTTKSWACSGLKPLAIVAGMALELHRLEHDVLPQLVTVQDDQEAKLKLDRGVLDALLLMKNSAVSLSRLRKEFKRALAFKGLVVHDLGLIPARLDSLRVVLKDTALQVLEGDCSIAWVREERVPGMVQLVTDLLASPVRFFSQDSDDD